jgi:MFS transporter, DHA2 family, glioxin efflux transporter
MPDLESSKRAVGEAEIEASNQTGSTSNSEHEHEHEHFIANGIQEKQDEDSVVALSLPAGDKLEPEYVTGLRLFLVMFTISMSGLLTALEIGIIATAIPEITNEFHSLNDVGWYGSTTFLVAGAASAMWGKLYKYLNVKYAYLAAIALFLVGSIAAAAAPNSTAVIVGRAFQGFGISGTMSGSIIVINYVAHPKRHPVLIGTWTGILCVRTSYSGTRVAPVAHIYYGISPTARLRIHTRQ